MILQAFSLFFDISASLREIFRIYRICGLVFFRKSRALSTKSRALSSLYQALGMLSQAIILPDVVWPYCRHVWSGCNHLSCRSP